MIRTLSWLLCSLIAVPAAANDTAMGGQGASLVPLATSDVFMQSEDITLTHSGVKGDPSVASGEARDREKWQVDARYVFVNPSDKAVTLQLGFPEYRCESRDEDSKEFCPYDKLFNFENMQTLVRGEPVRHRKGKVSKKHAWAPLLGGVWLFDLTLAPGEQVPVVHRYSVPTTLDSSGGRSVPYVTRTGALWARPIERARFTYRYPARACTIYPPEGVPFASFRIVEERGELLAEASYEVTSWKPEGDLDFYTQPCVPLRDYWEDDRQKVCAAHSELSRFVHAGLYYDTEQRSDEPPLSRDQVLAKLAALSADELRICRNAPFAAYGRPFANPVLSTAFYGAASVAPSTGALVPYKPSAHFTEKLLLPSDWRWVALVDEALSAREKPKEPTALATTEPAALREEGAPESATKAPPSAAMPEARAKTPLGCSLTPYASSSARAMALPLVALLWLTRRRVARLRSAGSRRSCR